MITPVAPIAASAAPISLADVRQRPAAGERPMLPDSTPTAPKAPSSSNNGQFPKNDSQGSQNPMPDHDRTSTFAAAVISGALSPTPQTMEQLIIRIGASVIPEESQARLKDLIA